VTCTRSVFDGVKPRPMVVDTRPAINRANGVVLNTQS